MSVFSSGLVAAMTTMRTWCLIEGFGGLVTKIQVKIKRKKMKIFQTVNKGQLIPKSDNKW